MDVGSRIKDARSSADMTQVELAERLEVAQGTVSRWEKNEVPITIVTLQRIAHATDKELHFFFEDGEAA